MIFQNAYLKLSAFYVLIVMIISLTFSVSIYRMASGEINSGLGRQIGGLGRGMNMLPADEVQAMREQIIQESMNNLQVRLIYFNLFILLGASVISYLLARRTLEPIEEMVAAQNRFTADASHELRTPLTAMRTEIEVNLRDKKLTLNEARELMASNLEEIAKLEDLANALLKLARYDEDVKMEFRKLSLKTVLGDAYKKVQSLATSKDIKIAKNFENVNVRGEKQSLTELFVILMDNAIKYSPKGAKVVIDVAKEKETALVKIKDEGVGIKASDIPFLFNRFFRADSSRSKEKVAGYGLGLSIAKQVVKLHSGEISVNSTPGKGSEFRVTLPKF